MNQENEIELKESFNEILRKAQTRGASDLHLKVGLPPIVRIVGHLESLSDDSKQMAPDDMENLAKAIISKRLWEQFEDLDEVYLGYGLRGVGRFRISVFRQRGTVSMAVRTIPYNVKSLDELLLPPVIKNLANETTGLVLVAGPAGCGKSTTLAAMVDHINSTRTDHIITIEDPIEFLIRDQKSIITQREINIDTNEFSSALKSALRQDPNVILLSDMPDSLTIAMALEVAETGRLALSCVPAFNAVETINRIISMFSSDNEDQIRAHLSSMLKGIVSQRLIQRKDNKGFAPATEIMIVNDVVREMILNPAKTSSIAEVIEYGADDGMVTFDQSMADLVKAGIID